MPSVIAVSSPYSIKFKVRYCVRKNIKPASTTDKTIKFVVQLAPLKLPNSQWFTVTTLSLSFVIYTIKFAIALHTALNAIPDSNNFAVLALEPIFARVSTAKETTNAPINANIPTKFPPKTEPIPRTIAITAPKYAPEDIPSTYGSANGFFTMACITVPQTDNPIPTPTAKIRRGSRINQTTS